MRLNSKKVNNVFFALNILIFIILLLTAITVKSKKDIPIYYEWDSLQVYYRDMPINEVLADIGKPKSIEQIKIGGELEEGKHKRLYRFLVGFSDTLTFQELYYRHGRYDFYLWLLPNRDSTWRVVDAVKFHSRKYHR